MTTEEELKASLTRQGKAVNNVIAGNRYGPELIDMLHHSNTLPELNTLECDALNVLTEKKVEIFHSVLRSEIKPWYDAQHIQTVAKMLNCMRFDSKFQQWFVPQLSLVQEKGDYTVLCGLAAEYLVDRTTSFHCCVSRCTGGSRYNTELTFHRIPSRPSDEEIRKKWLVKIRRDEGPSFKISSGTRVCSRHFSEEDYLALDNAGQRMLKRGSVPSIFDWSSQPKSRRKIVRHTDRLIFCVHIGYYEIG
ncbi:predicted protein [Nematostella vectensis]|uniref:THAP-type domain-containing protein n=1 Tax=Nematostella vectensis TaxID=45351 RepID=A7RQP8_NEMVE|nr:predicted protein [Nematostella vectensis]|eukprot:XP_001638264.1 predicted protein [Nematostella vectensis]